LPPQQCVRVPFVHEDFSEVPAIELLSAELALHEMCLVADRLARDLPADLPVLFDYRHGPSSKAGASPFFLVASSDEPRSGPRAGWFPRLALTPEREELERGVQGHVILVAVRVDSSLLRHSARAASRRYG